MEFLKLYDEENKNILFSMSWLNKNSIFDKSIGSFEDIDLFTFLENISFFDYKKDTFYDDIYYIYKYTQESILHLINNINKEIKREHKIVPISQAKEFDKKTILWLSRQDGRTIQEKLKNNKIKAVKRYRNVDTYENRIFKIFLKKLVLIEEKREQIQSNDYLISKVRQWLRSDDAKSINEYGNIIYNNILLHHPHYSKIFKSYKWLNRLDEKIAFYTTSYIQQLKMIIKFELLTQLQFLTTKAKILPISLEKNSLNNFDININNSLVKIDLEKYISQIQDKVLTQKISFKSIKSFAKWIIENQIKIPNSKDRTFHINTNQVDKVFIDLFRLFPIVKIGKKITDFPITLFQNIEGTFVNANNTKVIDLNNEFYTLSEILNTYDTTVLRVFLEKFEKNFKDKHLNYIIPDYVNIFEFSSVKKTINSYFPKSRNIPKSILSGMKYLFEGNLKENDTLIYIQKNHENDFFVTPLLVKYDKSLQTITNGLYLEKHPTKKLEESDSNSELNRYFDDDLSKKLLSKLLHNDIKCLKEEQIAFYLDNNLIYLNNSKNFSNSKDRIHQIKSLFKNKNLFQKDLIEIEDSNEENLTSFEQLLEFEKDNFILWKEHLPRLAMGNMPMNGYFGEFILVDDNSKVVKGVIDVEHHFSIPANTLELSFPLLFGEENINFEAYITSNQLPFKEDVECELELKYNYEDETPYRLTFIPLDKRYKPLNVKWREIQDKECNDLPIPSYPPKKSWQELEKFKNKDNSETNLLDWISKDFKKIIDIYCFFSQKCKSKRVYIDNIDFDWWKDRKGLYASKVTLDSIGEVFFHQNSFDQFHQDINSVSFEIESSDRGGYRAVNVSSNKSLSKNIIKKLQKSIRFPLYTIWKDGRTLIDMDVPNEFRELTSKTIQSALNLLDLENIPENLEIENLKIEMFRFLSIINQDSDERIFNTLLIFAKNEKEFQKYFEYFGYMIGCKNRESQKKLWDVLIKKLNSKKEKEYSNSLKSIGIVLWRCEDIAKQLTEKEVILILEKLYNSLDLKVREKNKFLRYKTKELRPSISIRLELLLGVLRSRLNNSQVQKHFCPDQKIIKKYIKLIDIITKRMILENIILKSRIDLSIEKPQDFKNTPDLLYALRMYLLGNIEAVKSIKVLGVSDD